MSTEPFTLRQTAPSSFGNRKGITVRPTAAEHEEVARLAQQWGCSVTQAGLRLLRAGLANPSAAPVDSRVSTVCSMISDGQRLDTVYGYCSKQWGLNRVQASDVIKQARTMLEHRLIDESGRFHRSVIRELMEYEKANKLSFKQKERVKA